MPRSQPGRSSRLVVLRLLLAGFSIGLSLLFAEAVIRLVAPRPPSWVAIYRNHPAIPAYSLQPNAREVVDTGETHWTVDTDENGFRTDPELEQEADCTALWLGDSYAFGHGVEYSDSFVGRLDREHPDMRNLNASVAGYGPVQYRQTLEYLGDQGLSFDMLFVVTYVGNDFNDTLQNKDLAVVDGILGNQSGLKSLLKRNLHLYRAATAVYHRFATQQESPYAKALAELATPEIWSEGYLADAYAGYSTEMARILDYAERRGARVAFVILPTREAVERLRGEDASETADSSPGLPVEKARAALSGLDAPVLDLTPIIAEHPSDEMYFRFDGHLTNEGSAIVADAIRERLKPHCGPNPEAS